MVKTQVQLTEEMLVGLRQMAKKRGVSVAQIIRESLARTLQNPLELDPEERRRRLLSVSGKFRFHAADTAVNHDKYFAESITEKLEDEWSSS